MKRIDYEDLLMQMKGLIVESPYIVTSDILSNVSIGQPFETYIYQFLKQKWPHSIFKQHEYIKDIYLKHPKIISTEARRALYDSPTILYVLIERGNEWNDLPENIFQEKQNDTADIVFYDNGYYDLIDVKTRNRNKDAQAPNIISAYKLAKTCACMIDNDEFDNLSINYIEIDWVENGNQLECVDAHYGNLFKAHPNTLYINWAAAMQIQFHVCDLDQTWEGTHKEWAKEYIRVFVESAKHRCQRMQDMYITPFLKYLD